MAERLEHLLEPIRIGGRQLRNRVICTGHNPHYGNDGLIGDQQIAFHVQKALGGVGRLATAWRRETSKTPPSRVIVPRGSSDRPGAFE